MEVNQHEWKHEQKMEKQHEAKKDPTKLSRLLVATFQTTQRKMNQKNNVCVLPITRKLLESQRRKTISILTSGIMLMAVIMGNNQECKG
jgi:hypothetical protein